MHTLKCWGNALRPKSVILMTPLWSINTFSSCIWKSKQHNINFLSVCRYILDATIFEIESLLWDLYDIRLCCDSKQHRQLTVEKASCLELRNIFLAMPVNYLFKPLGKPIKHALLLEKLLTILSKSSPPFTYSRTIYIFTLLAKTWLFISQLTPFSALEFNSHKYHIWATKKVSKLNNIMFNFYITFRFYSTWSIYMFIY